MPAVTKRRRERPYSYRGCCLVSRCSALRSRQTLSGQSSGFRSRSVVWPRQPVGWSIPSLIAPHGGTGTIGGIMNFFNNMMGVAAPIATGYIVSMTGSFTGAFLAAGIVLVVGIVAFVFILGPLEPIADPPPLGERTAPV